ncbi:MAG: hypothetical protein SVS15_04725 [Thermodesulfobacteriota bacterium]|nr:hypothetical protein [Thermodesulfobacteriota bacterium]
MRGFFCLLALFLVTAPVLAQKPKTRADTERVDWAEVFAKPGNRTEEFDWSHVLDREKRDTERVDWGEVFGSPKKKTYRVKTPPRPAKEPAAPLAAVPEKSAPAPLVRRLEPAPLVQKLEPAPISAAPGPDTKDFAVPDADKEPPAVVDADKHEPGLDRGEKEPLVDAGMEPFVADESEERAELAPEPGPEVQVAAVDENAARERLTPKALYSKEFIDHFLGIALFDQEEQFIHHRGGGHRPRPKVLTKWDRDIQVKIRGELSLEERAGMEEAISDFGAVLERASGISMRLLAPFEDAASANLIIYVLAPRRGPDISGYVKNVYGDNARIVRSDVVLYSGQASPGIVRRQLMHALGFLGRDFKGQDSVMSVSARPDFDAGPFPEIDARALELLYRPELAAGMDLESVREAASSLY